jgi:hypothetical protein
MRRVSGATNLARAVASAGGVQNMQDNFELRPRKSKVMAQTTWAAVHELAFVRDPLVLYAPSLLGRM